VPLDVHVREPTRALSRNGWWLPGLWLFTLVLPYPFLPAVVQGCVYLATGFGAVLALQVGMRLFRPAAPAPWYLLSTAFGFFFLGDLLTFVHLDAGGMPSGPWSDLSYLTFYPLTLWALVLLMRRSPDRDAAAWLDSVIWTIGAGVLAWEWLFEGSSLVEQPTVASIITVLYPGMDLVLLLVLLRLVFASIRGNSALLLLAVGLGVQLVTDSVYLADLSGSGYDSGHLLDLGWLFTYTAVAAAALHPSMALSGPGRDRRHEARLGGWRIPLLLVPALTAPVTLALLTLTGSLAVESDDVAVATTATFLVLILAASRGSGLVRLANRRADDLTVRVDHDTLTGLASRYAFARELTDVVDDPTVQADPWSVIFLDLDDFKIINDLQGHLAGDQMLEEVGRRLRAAAPRHAVVARFGGDEFALLVRSTAVEPVVTRILAAIDVPLLLQGREVRFTVSIGSAVATPGMSADELMRCVDVAMYDAKRSGRSWARYDPQMSHQLLSARDDRERLAGGIAQGEVVPWFQPVVHLETGALQGFEALARWVAPDRLPAAPADQWLPLAEQSDLIVAVDRHVMRAAVQQLARWRDLFAADELTMAVNMSGRTLHQPGIEDEVLEQLRQAGVPCDRLVVEITEGIPIQDDEVGIRLQRLRARGVRIALDDFGTGWSSLSYLRRFPVDVLKLDRSFTRELGDAADATAIPAAVVQLAAALHLAVVAEGVETQHQRAALLHLGFDSAQGFLYSPARPGAELDSCVLRACLDVDAPAELSSRAPAPLS
jgi:diguanylate cyclase